MNLGGYRSVIVIICGAMVAASAAVSAAQQPPPDTDPPASPRTDEELADLDNWVGIVRNANVEPKQRTFNARKLLLQDWPEARRAALELLDNRDKSGACIPVCRAIRENLLYRAEFVDPLLGLLGDGDGAVRAKAAEVLSGYQDPVVADRLLAIGKDGSAAAVLRTSAIGVLAQLQDSHKAAGMLIALLDDLDGQIDSAVYGALTKIAGEQAEPGAEGWQQWWDKFKDLPRAQWLEQQLKLSEERNAHQETQIKNLQNHLVNAYEQVYTLAGNGDRKELLQSYLRHDERVIRLLALQIIRREIGDGGRPDEDVTAALRSRLADPAPEIRADVLDILGNLRNPDDAPAVMELLAGEADTEVRLAGIATLGQLSNPQANSILIVELQGQSNAVEYKIASARSIGRINAKGNVNGQDLGDVVRAIAGEYGKSSQLPELRTELLFAMASIADSAFAPALRDNLPHEQANVRRRCVTGLRQLGDKSNLEAMLPYIGDPDVGVRREVALSIGQFGSQDVHLSALLGRLDPDTEQDAAVRDALWDSLEALWEARAIADQLSWIRKMTELPDRQLELAKDMEDRLDENDPPPAALLEVRVLLATQYAATGRHDESARYWTTVVGMRRKAGDATWKDAAVNQIAALLRAGRYARGVTDAEVFLAEDLQYFKPGLGDRIIAVLDHEKAAGRNEQVAQLRDLVKSSLTELLDDAFRARLLPFEDPDEQPVTEQPTPPTTDPGGEENLSEAPHGDG